MGFTALLRLAPTKNLSPWNYSNESFELINNRLRSLGRESLINIRLISIATLRDMLSWSYIVIKV